ncbi:sensor histidine kinase [Kutzneria kofuensis]|uniref:histidine kinase n=1 Tax=Kutzneria kofuensis TaxID=103725 RepID=A0A7W9KGE5_9PSEU|nr:histidine kinase [Kutzneria kofuensis]MBB5891334.1 signal transduction histidine kinase [Kutzneria kofuensis]
MTAPVSRQHIVDRLAPSWLVIQLLGSGIMIGTLATATVSSPWLWVVYGASLFCWVLFVVVDPRMPRLGATMVAISGLLPAFVTGLSTDGTASILVTLVVGRFVILTIVPGSVLLGYVVACVAATMGSCAVLDRPPAELFGYPAVILLLFLLGLNRREQGLRTEQAERLLSQIALTERERSRAAALDERTRIAQEIQDVLAHSLGALSVQLKLAEALIEGRDRPGALRTLHRSDRLVDEGLREARNAVAALRAGYPSLPEALAQLVQEHQNEHSGTVDLRTEGELRATSPAATVSLVRTAREALTNAAKHAPSAPVTMTLAYDRDKVRLDVVNAVRTDDQPPDERSPGYGLAGMRERLALFGGTLVAGHHDEGTSWRVTAEVSE